jgi:uncharacterized membrane protein YfcA
MDFSSPWFLAVMIMCGSYIGAWFIRRVVELKWPHLRPAKMPAKLAVEDTDLAGSKVTGQVSLYSTPVAEWWNTLILYALAPAAGMGFAILARTADNYPPELKPLWLTIVFGITLGFFSSLGFKAFKKIFSEKAGIQLDDQGNSIAPPGS